MQKAQEKDLINLVNNSSKLIGTRQVLKAIINGAVTKVIVANNIYEVLFEKIKDECAKHHIPMVRAFTKFDLGTLCHIDVDCAVVGLVK